MRILKQHSHKRGLAFLTHHHQDLLDEISQVVESISSVECLTKISEESAKVKRWGGLIFSPIAINRFFKQALYPKGWAVHDENSGRYVQPRHRFRESEFGEDRYREMDGVKNRVGLEIQFGKYAFMGYDIFSKMIIFKNLNVIDCGIEIVLAQEMVNCMSTGVSAFEHLMVDFKYRGEADIDMPVLVLGIGPTEAEWEKVYEIQEMFKTDPEAARNLYPMIGSSKLFGTKPGPK